MTLVSRLAQKFLPEHYELSIDINRPDRSFNGTVTINGRSITDAKTIVLHANDLMIKSVLIDGKKADFTKRPNDEIELQQPNMAAGKHIIVIAYSGKITDDMNGMYPCYFKYGGQKQELIATQFESHYARKVFPCVDEPEAKATFDVSLTTELDVDVIGNMPIRHSRIENNRLVSQFETTPKMSCYLLAWVVGKLQKKTAVTKRGVTVSVWATKAHPAASLDFGLDIATRTIDFFEEYFGVEYPLPKSDHVALPDFSAGAMENWGLITYREIALLAEPDLTSVSNKQNIALVIAHELSHQWFGNLVTMKWWNDLWLNESFANLMEYVAVDALEPDWNIWLDYATDSVISALRRDSLEGVQPVQVDVSHPDEISTLFDPSIVYAKGSRLLRMLEAYIGTPALRRGLKQYFTDHAYGNTEAADLWQALTASSKKDISKLMNSWIKQPGYPVVTVSQTKNGNIKLEQDQFFVGAHTESDRLWPIPLHANSQQAPQLLTSKSASFKITGNNLALRLNLGATTHFISKYSPNLRDQIIDSIPDLPAVDRLLFLQEQTLLAQANEQSFATIVPLLSHFSSESNQSVWEVISLSLAELKKFVEHDQQAENQLRRLAQEISKYNYQRLGWDPKPNEAENDTNLRRTIIALAIYGQNPDAEQEATRRFNSTPIAKLYPELRGAIMAHEVLSTTNDKLIQKLLKAYTSTANNELQLDIVHALTSSRALPIINQLTDLLLDTTTVRSQDFIYWYVGLFRNRYGRTALWDWTRQNWPNIEKLFKNDAQYDMLPRYIAGSLVSKQHLTEYLQFFGPKKDQISLKRAINMGLTELQAKAELIDRDSTNVCDALKSLHFA